MTQGWLSVADSIAHQVSEASINSEVMRRSKFALPVKKLDVSHYLRRLRHLVGLPLRKARVGRCQETVRF